jgi:hypothetical protein
VELALAVHREFGNSVPPHARFVFETRPDYPANEAKLYEYYVGRTAAKEKKICGHK